MATARRHLDIGGMFLHHAEKEFRQDDLLQAAEKAWGAVAHLVNAIATEQGWRVGTHRKLIENARRIITLDADQASHRLLLLRSVNSLHANFYQDFMSREDVRDGITNAKELVAALKTLAEHLPGGVHPT